MAVYFATTDPSRLLSILKTAIDDGRVTTWSYDAQGDFTHTARQWARRAWMVPAVSQTELVFGILAPSETVLSVEVYAIYHGRLIEMALAHADKYFESAYASALPEDADTT